MSFDFDIGLYIRPLKAGCTTLCLRSGRTEMYFHSNDGWVLSFGEGAELLGVGIPPCGRNDIISGRRNDIGGGVWVLGEGLSYWGLGFLPAVRNDIGGVLGTAIGACRVTITIAS